MALRNVPNRRTLIKNAAFVAAGLHIAPGALSQTRNVIAPGPFNPAWESLKQWRMPDWFRDAKFGIWAHWSAQCVPEQGDWYAREMYIQGSPKYEYHCRTYGHPSKFGFKDVDHMWKAERWQPEQLMDLYVRTGAKYFMALACHHDNLDCFDSTHHAWNTTKVGPQKDIVGTWEKVVRSRGLRFGISNHSAHAWHWLQTAYGYDPEGPLAGVRYDAYTSIRRNGRGKWWDGLDPQELYTGRNIVLPDGIKTIDEAKRWHEAHDRVWNEAAPPMDPEFTRTWYLRCKELVDRYKPDMLYFDDTELPLGQTGLDITAHFYNANLKWHHGSQEAVVAAKEFTPQHSGAAMLDIERGRTQSILDAPWQTDTCIGDWHYSRSVFEKHTYKTPDLVAQMLVDIVSKNGNLMLNIPVRGDGTIDEDEHAFLETFGRWMAVHGEAIYGTRPFKVYGEGPQDVNGSPNFNEGGTRKLNAEDIRFTQKGDVIYAFILGWPGDGRARLKSLRQSSPLYSETVRSVELLGTTGKLQFKQTPENLVISLPPRPENHLNAFAFRILS